MTQWALFISGESIVIDDRIDSFLIVVHVFLNTEAGKQTYRVFQKNGPPGLF